MKATLPAANLCATIEQLWVYPGKSCAGLQLAGAELTDIGLLHDRDWRVVNRTGEFVSQRELPRMALIQPSFKRGQLVLCTWRSTRASQQPATPCKAAAQIGAWTAPSRSARTRSWRRVMG